MASARPSVVFDAFGPIRRASTTSLRLCSEDRRVDGPGWDGEQQIGDSTVVAFSLRPVRIRFEGELPVVLSPAVVATPPAGSAYRREPLCPLGQRTVFLSSAPRLAATLRAEHRREDERPADAAPFGPADPAACAMACRLERAVFAPGAVLDPFFLEEVGFEIIARSLGRGTPRAGRGTAAEQRRWRGVCNTVASVLCERFADPPSIAELAEAHALSPAYLSRRFREHTGQTLHTYLTTVRLIRAVEMVPDTKGRLSRVAYTCGFSSHAHLSEAFRRVLGTTPRSVAAGGRGAMLAELRHRISCARSGESPPVRPVPAAPDP